MNNVNIVYIICLILLICLILSNYCYTYKYTEIFTNNIIYNNMPFGTYRKKLLCNNFLNNSIESFTDKVDKIDNVEFPFKNMIDKNGKNLDIILITAPFRETSHYEKYEKFKKDGIKIIGITSYLQFPDKVLNPHDPAMKSCWKDKTCEEYINKCDAWLYCMRNANELFKGSNKPILEIAQSDFSNPDNVKPKLEIPIEYDFIYCCLNDNDKCTEGWNSINRNWKLAQKCFEIMCLKYKLKVLIIGRINCKLDNEEVRKYLTFLDFQPYHKFHECINKAKYVFIPNVMDASPRILAESLCLNKPALVNKNIVGGWKYINDQTGELFTNENDVEKALKKLLENFSKYTPRKYFSENYGPQRCGKLLAGFLKGVYPDFKEDYCEPYCCR